MAWGPHVASIGVVYAKNGDEAAEALERGCRVVTDKPAAVTEAQLRRLRNALAGERPGVLLTEFDMRCQPAVRAAQQAVAAGRIGKPLLATARKSYKMGNRAAFYSDPAAVAGIVPWVLSHAVDLVRHVTGLHPTPIATRIGEPLARLRSGMEDHAAALLAIGEAGSAVCHADYLRPNGAAGHGDDQLRVAGETGIVEIRDGVCTLSGEGTSESIKPSTTTSVEDELLAALNEPWPAPDVSLAGHRRCCRPDDPRRRVNVPACST